MVQGLDESIPTVVAAAAVYGADQVCCDVSVVVMQLDRLGHARGGDVTGRIRENLYDRKLLQQKLGHLQVRTQQQLQA